MVPGGFRVIETSPASHRTEVAGAKNIFVETVFYWTVYSTTVKFTVIPQWNLSAILLF